MGDIYGEWPRTGTIIDAVGRTPLIRLPSPRKGVTVLAKLEKCNPGGSIKDRPAALILWDAVQRGSLRDDKYVLESSSGNMGIAMTAYARALGFPAVITLSAEVGIEIRQLLQAYGATVIDTPAAEGSDGATRKMQEIVAYDSAAFAPHQYDNELNPLAHYLTTGPEIWQQTAGSVTHFVAGVGTGGTVMGTGRYLREKSAKVRITAVEPDAASHGLRGLRHVPSTITPKIYDPGGYDDLVRVDTAAALQAMAMLGERGVKIGISSGAAYVAMQSVACEAPQGSVIVGILPDGYERYLMQNLLPIREKQPRLRRSTPVSHHTKREFAHANEI